MVIKDKKAKKKRNLMIQVRHLQIKPLHTETMNQTFAIGYNYLSHVQHCPEDETQTVS
jgi:hypothetical protein